MDKHVEKLKSRIRNLKKEPLDIECHGIWNLKRRQIAEKILEDDVSNFCNWRNGTAVGLFFTLQSFAPFRYLRDHTSEWPRWREAMKDSPIGNPEPDLFYPETSENLIHQARHLARLVEKTGCEIEKLEEIFEFGGGYGCLCRLIFRLGFQGRYVIYDLPELIALQEYYLSQIDVTPKPKIFYNEATDESNCIVLTDNLDILKKQIQINKGQNDLFIGTWSVSENVMSEREKLFAVVRSMKYYLIAYAGTWRGEESASFGNVIDNIEYFRLFEARHYEYDWSGWKVPYLGDNQYYTIGVRKVLTSEEKERLKKESCLILEKLEYEHENLLKKQKKQRETDERIRQKDIQIRKEMVAARAEHNRKHAEILERRRLFQEGKQKKLREKQEAKEKSKAFHDVKIQRKLGAKQRKIDRHKNWKK